MREVTEIFIPC